MAKPVATNITITLQQQGATGVSVKPLLIDTQKTVVQTNRGKTPILPHQPVASEQDRAPDAPGVEAGTLNDFKTSLPLERVAVLGTDGVSGEVKLRDFTREQVDLFYRRYKISEDN